MLETILLNSIGKVRYATQNGRRMLVAPMTIIVPGVLPGSKGKGYYSPEETSKNVKAWNGMPILINHPYKGGVPVEASEDGVWEKQGVGVLRNTHFKKKLRTEGWFDEELLKAKSPKVYNKLKANIPVELSTGLHTVNVPAEPGATLNGDQFEWRATKLRPDHLAVLPDQAGACSLKDGCGVLVNEATDTIPDEVQGWTRGTDGTTWVAVMNAAEFEMDEKRSVMNKLLSWVGLGGDEPTEEEVTDNAVQKSHEQRRGAVSQALRGKFKQDEPSPWISDMYDDHVVYEQGGKLYRHDYEMNDKDGTCSMTGKPTPVRREVSYVTANEADQTEPPSPESPLINEDPSMAVKLTAEQKAEAITFLTTNCECWKGDEKTLNSLPDASLQRLREDAEKHAGERAVFNAATTGFKFGEKLFRFDLEKNKFVVNAFPPPKKKGGAAEDAADGGVDDAEEETPPAKKKPTANASIKERLTEDELEVWNHVEAHHSGLRTQLIGKLTANIKDPVKKKAAVATFNEQKTSVLQTLVDNMPAPPAAKPKTPTANSDEDSDLATTLDALFVGNAGGGEGASGSDGPDPSDILPIPTLNYGEISKENSKRRTATA